MIINDDDHHRCYLFVIAAATAAVAVTTAAPAAGIDVSTNLAKKEYTLHRSRKQRRLLAFRKTNQNT